jgi:hypothetical protein
MKVRTLVLMLALVGGLFVPKAHADETTFCNTYITSLPYTIRTQGHYCFNTNLSTAMTTGAAIEISVDHVVLDLNNFKLGGGSAGLATEAVGIYVNNHSNLTIRGGNIRGFAKGILIEGTTNTSSTNIVIENNVLGDNTMAAIAFMARAVTVRNNTIYNTGGSTVTPNPMCDATFAITTTHRCTGLIDFAASAVIVDNTIMDTFPPANLTETFVISAGSTSGSIVANNRLVNSTGTGLRSALVINSFVGGVCRDNTSAKSSTKFTYRCSQLVGTNSSSPDF